MYMKLHVFALLSLCLSLFLSACNDAKIKISLGNSSSGVNSLAGMDINSSAATLTGPGITLKASVRPTGYNALNGGGIILNSGVVK
jgi:hypothetical protein